MTKRQDTTIAINGERNAKLKDAVVEIITSTREPIKASNIVHYLIDNYLEEAIKDMKQRSKI
ncbi:MAG: hypothetical protein ACJAXS_002568 [Colwellia sp.]|jgi:hypothetical protein